MARRIHGISQRDTREGPTFLDIWPTLLSIITGKEIISYGVAFDLHTSMDSHSLQHRPHA